MDQRTLILPFLLIRSEKREREKRSKKKEKKSEYEKPKKIEVQRVCGFVFGLLKSRRNDTTENENARLDRDP
jgi:hypothetical protein